MTKLKGFYFKLSFSLNHYFNYNQKIFLFVDLQLNFFNYLRDFQKLFSLINVLKQLNFFNYLKDFQKLFSLINVVLETILFSNDNYFY